MNHWGATPPNNARGQNLCLTVCKITGTNVSKITPSNNMFDKWRCLEFTNEFDLYIRFLNLHKFWLMVHKPGKYREKKANTNSRCWVDIIWFYDALHNDNGTQHHISTQQVTWRHLNEHLFSGWVHMLIVQHIQVVVQSQCDKRKTRSHNSTSCICLSIKMCLL